MGGENQRGFSMNLTLQSEQEAIPCKTTISDKQCDTGSGDHCEL